MHVLDMYFRVQESSTEYQTFKSAQNPSIKSRVRAESKLFLSTDSQVGAKYLHVLELYPWPCCLLFRRCHDYKEGMKMHICRQVTKLLYF